MKTSHQQVPLLDRIIVGAGFLGGGLVVLTGIFVSYEVIRRYFFNSPTTWVLEISIYVVLASNFLSFAYVLRENGHVKVDFLTNHLSPQTARILEVSTSLLGLLYCLVMAYEGGMMTLSSFLRGEVSPTILNVPIFIPQLFIPLGAILLVYQFCQILRNLWKGIKVYPSDFQQGTERTGSNLIPFVITGLFVFSLVLGFVLLKTSMHLGLLLLFFILLFSGLQVAIALGLFGVFSFYALFGGVSMLVQVPVLAYSTLDSFVMVALPLFILTSSVLRNGEIGIRIYKFANVLVRHLPGGLGISSVIFCGLFAAMTGSSVAVAAAVSMIALPEMLARGYDRKLVIGLLAAGGTLGILFPPSIAMILYGSMTNESVGSLFMAGLIPGLILSGMFCLYVAIVAGRDKNIQREPRASAKEIVEATRDAAGGLITILIIIGGIYSGIFTPTESGGVAGVYSLCLCSFIYHSLSWQGIKKSIFDTAKISAMIMLIIIGANISGQVILMAQISQQILTFVKSLELPTWVVILSINLFLIIMGGPLEAISILVITLPILYPLVTGLGFSGLWFAVIMVINMELALISPPEGLNLFILQNLAKSTASEVSRGVIPFLVIIALFLILISCWPGLTTWLPSVIMK
ncbi:MAG TPA: TRAP transporter large permease subunit [Thermodesulfobacteriota bacterium]|nr:TRAP transporter large permease subunit [Thermodesulfobacteriota bacterium]